MHEFRRPPDWDQQADRHTALIDPVLTVRQLSRLEFVTRKPPTRIDHALVFATADGGYEVFVPPHRPSRTEAAARRYTAVYEVDMGRHPVNAELNLPSDNDAFEFGVQAELFWQVTDPARFITSGHRDVPALVLGRLREAARPVARGFAIDRSADAERALLRALYDRGPLGEDAGLRVDWTVRVRRDGANIAHQQRLQSIDHDAAENVRRSRRGAETDRAENIRLQARDSLELERAMSYGEQHHELASKQLGWQHEQNVQAQRQAVELQRLEAEKIEFYRWHLERGGATAMAMHLSHHPEDSRLVMENLRQDELALIETQKDLVVQLLGGKGDVEEYELEGPKKLALETVKQILAQRRPGVHGEPDADAPKAAERTGPDPVPVSDWKPPAGYGTLPQMPSAPPPAPTPPTPPAAPPLGPWPPERFPGPADAVPEVPEVPEDDDAEGGTAR
ncbi:hypothetical protein [Streptomyces sp. 184]|uniref:hypothetical protein n=1 Tax=Streptomyces sp. 184 TaxID=1827526 RepID=UPI0038912A66